MEQVQVRVAFHPPEVRLDVYPRGRTPALFLIARVPATNAVGLRFDTRHDTRHDTLDQIRCREAGAEFGEHAKPMPRARFLEAFLETAGRRRVARREFGHELLPGAFRVGIPRVRLCGCAYAVCRVRRQITCKDFGK